jgi:hypothetical protein
MVIAAAEQLPDNARILVGQGRYCHIKSPLKLKPAAPSNQQRAQIALPRLLNLEQHVAIAAGVLTRHQFQPRREFPAALEFARIANCGDHHPQLR